MLGLLVGAALYAQPPHVKFPGLAVFAALRALARRRKRSSDARDDDPHAGVTLRWRGITCELHAKRPPSRRPSAAASAASSSSASSSSPSPPRTILRDVGGAARPGRLLAIMGPSGSGKTSLLNVLARQVPFNPKMTLRGELIATSDDAAQTSAYRVAYVQQQDVFYSQLTVRETLHTAAELRMPRGSHSPAERAAAVDDALRRLGLAKCADTRVGDAKTRGVSGGERKRLALACELVGDSPAVVCADEPTSGLDAFQAQRVMESLRDLARDERKTVVASIHQPRGSIVELFDDVCLMAGGGRVVYCGPAEDAARWFAARGHPVPTACNPAEFLVDLVSVDASSPEAEEASTRRVDALADAWASRERNGEGVSPLRKRDIVAGILASPFKSTSWKTLNLKPGANDDAGSIADVSDAASSSRKSSRSRRRGVGFVSQFLLLARRSWRQVRRDGRTNRVRLMTSLNSAFVFGSIFWRMGRTQTSIQDRLGLLQVSAINAAMAALMKTLTAFTSEKVIVDRERASGAYGTLPYLAAKLVAELPVGAFFPLAFGAVAYPMTGLNPTLDRFGKFCGVVVLESFTSSAMGLAVSSVAPSTEAAVAMGPAVMVLFIVFGGYYVNPDNVPPYFRWINKCSLIKWAFQGLCVNEFRGLDFEPAGLQSDQRHGEEVLERLSFGDATVASTAKEQANVLGFCYLLTLHLLEKSAPKFMVVEPRDDRDEGEGVGGDPTPIEEKNPSVDDVATPKTVSNDDRANDEGDADRE